MRCVDCKKKHLKKSEDGPYRLSMIIPKTSEPLEYNLIEEAGKILIKYLQHDNQFIFPMLDKLRSSADVEVKRLISSSNAKLNITIKKLVTRSKIQKSISMHCARHTYAVISIDLGADLYVISKMLGHKSIATTEIYAKMVDKRKDELTELWNNKF